MIKLSNDQRALALTHEQIELIKDVFGIAESYYLDMIERVCKNRHDKNQATYWREKYNKIGDLKEAIIDGHFDI